MYRIDCPGGILLCPATQSRQKRTRSGGSGFREREEGALGLSDADVQRGVCCELETVLMLEELIRGSSWSCDSSNELWGSISADIWMENGKVKALTPRKRSTSSHHLRMSCHFSANIAIWMEDDEVKALTPRKRFTSSVYLRI